VLGVCFARFMFESGESAFRSRARPNQPPSFVSPVVVERTAVEAVSNLSESSLVLSRICPGFVRGGCRWPPSPMTVVVDGGATIGRSALVSDEGASWVAAARYEKDGARRRVVTQRTVSARHHPWHHLKRLCLGDDRCYSSLPTHKNLGTEEKIMFLGQKGDVPE
jgi:hypothetical protein